MRQILALAVKDLRLLLRDRAGAFFILVFPLLVAVFFGTIFSGGGDGPASVDVAVVDEDRTSGSRAFVERLDATHAIAVERASRTEAAASVRGGDRPAYLVIRQGFGAATRNPFSGTPPAVELGVDPGRSAEAGWIEGVATRVAGEILYGGAPDVGPSSEPESGEGSGADGPPGSAGDSGSGSFGPLAIRRSEVVAAGGPEPPSAYAISFPQGIIWGIIGCAIGFATAIVVERTGGTLQRLRVAPISRARILAGKAVAGVIAILMVGAALVAFGTLVFGLRPESWGLLAGALVSSAVCFVGIMMMLSVFGRTERSASGIASGTLLVLAMLGGGMIPLFVMPEWMRQVSDVSPVKWSVLAIEGALWRGFSPAEMILPCAVLVGLGVITFAAGARLFPWSESG